MDYTPLSPVVPYIGYRGQNTAIPSLYWNEWTAEQRIRCICEELRNVECYAADLGIQTNLNIETINELGEILEQLQNGGWFDEYAEQIQAWIEDIQNLTQLVDDRIAANETVSVTIPAIQASVDTIEDTTIPAIQASIDTIEDTDLPALRNEDLRLSGLIADLEDATVHRIVTTGDFATLDPEEGDLYRTEGFTASKDGGSGLYLIETGASADGMTSFSTADPELVAVLVVEGAVKPAQLGAVSGADSAPVLNYLLSDATSGLPVVLAGSYTIASGVSAVAARLAEVDTTGCTITASASMDTMLDIVEPYVHQTTLSGLSLDGDGLASIGLAVNSRSVNLTGIAVRNCTSEQIHAYGNTSGHAHYTNLSLFGTQSSTCKGLVLELNDMMLSNVTVFYCHIGIELAASQANILSDIHIWPGTGNAASQYQSIGVNVLQTGMNQFTDLYVDGVNTGVNFPDNVGGFCKIKGGMALWPDMGSGTTPYQYDNPCIVRIGSSATVNVGIQSFYNGSTSPDYVYIRTATETQYTDLNGLIENDNFRLLTGSAYGQINVAESRMYNNRIARIINNSKAIVNGNYYPVGYIIAPGNMPASADNSVNVRITPTSNRVGTFGWADFYVHILRTTADVYTVNVTKDVRETYGGFEFCIGAIERVKCGSAASDYNYWAYPVYLHALSSRTIGDLWLGFEAPGQKFNWFAAGNAVAVDASSIIATLNMATV